MNYLLFLSLLALQIHIRVPFVFGKHKEECPFGHTVDLSNQQPIENGSYLYQGVLIPPAKQHSYDYELKFLGEKTFVAPHLRGCVCDRQPCIKLCCSEDEYLYETETSTQCEKLKMDMDVSWNLSLRRSDGVEGIKNLFEHFVYQVGFPCKSPKPIDKEENAVIFENGTVYAQKDNSFLTTRDYCYSPHLNEKSEYILYPFSCPMRNNDSWSVILNTYGMAISVLFLIPTIVVYLALKELRGNLSGKLLICYLCSLTIGYSIITFINISNMRFTFIPCSLLGFTCYFFFMAAYFWLSVLCFDIWINFTETTVEFDSRKNIKYFAAYSLYAWLSAGLATGIIFYIEVSPDIDDVYKPGIGKKMCWLNTDKWSALIYFYGPALLILLLNSVAFIHLTYRVYNIKRDLARITQTQKFFKKHAIVILRLFLIMGISWIFDIVSYCVREYKNVEFLFILSDFMNAIQGVSIFALFVLKPNVLNLLKKRCKKVQVRKSSSSVSSCSTNFSKLQTLSSVQPIETAL